MNPFDYSKNGGERLHKIGNNIKALKYFSEVSVYTSFYVT